jgi:hypothetical protein
MIIAITPTVIYIIMSEVVARVVVALVEVGVAAAGCANCMVVCAVEL